MKIIDELERLNENATPGEWTYDDGIVYSQTEPPSQYEIPRLFIGKHIVEVQNLRDSDSELIVLMRNKIDVLTQAVRCLEHAVVFEQFTLGGSTYNWAMEILEKLK